MDSCVVPERVRENSGKKRLDVGQRKMGGFHLPISPSLSPADSLLARSLYCAVISPVQVVACLCTPFLLYCTVLPF